MQDMTSIVQGMAIPLASLYPDAVDLVEELASIPEVH